jgi:hypothetical protein
MNYFAFAYYLQLLKTGTNFNEQCYATHQSCFMFIDAAKQLQATTYKENYLFAFRLQTYFDLKN